MRDPSAPLPADRSYASLPTVPGTDLRCAWDVFAPGDELGTLRRQTPERVLAATRVPRSGRVFSLNWELEKPSPAILGRQNLRHTVIDLAPIAHPGTDDHYDEFWPQASSQWDALGHMGHPVAGFYGGRTLADVVDEGRNGIHNAARRGIAGRFVLLDVDRHLRRTGRLLDQTAATSVSVDVLDEVLESQGVHVGTGDVLLLRFGWITWYEQASEAERRRISAAGYFHCPGLETSERTAAWLWDLGIAAVAADNPTVEVLPPQVDDSEGFLHYRIIPLLGMTVGELLSLDPLADDCAEDGRYEGLFVAAPLNKHGGAGSPANALAIK